MKRNQPDAAAPATAAPTLKRKHPDAIRHVLMAPSLIFFAALTIFPLVFNIIMSLCSWKLGGNIRFVGLENYISAFQNGVFWRTMLNTVVITLVAVAVEYVLGMVLAYNINKLIHGKKLIRIAMLLPMLMAPVVIGFMWKQMFNELYGPLNHILSLFGIPGIPWISKSGVSLVAVILVDIWEWTPFITLILLAGFQSLPKEPLESARVDGAKEGRIFFDLIFKMLLPASTVAPAAWAADLFGDAGYEGAVRSITVAYTLGTLLFGPVPGLLADRFGGYEPAYALFALCLVLSLGGLQAVYRAARVRG